jgi:hypothetical protein
MHSASAHLRDELLLLDKMYRNAQILSSPIQMSLSPAMREGTIAPNIDATKFYYPNQEPPAAFLASFRRSVWKSSVSFFPGLAYKGLENLWWTYPFFLTVPIRPVEENMVSQC